MAGSQGPTTPVVPGGGAAIEPERRRPAWYAIGLGVIALVAVGCGSSKSTSSNNTAGLAAPGSTITANMTEYHIALSSTRLSSPGTYTFDAVNSGHIVHTLEISGPGIDSRLKPDLQPGQSADLTVTLQAGTYDVFCPIPGHKQLGMNVDITVGR